MKFENIVGYEQIKKELELINNAISNYKLLRPKGIITPRGVVLVGAPGLGKTLFATEFAKESKREIFLVRKTEPSVNFCKRFKAILEDASLKQPSIIVLDDMDQWKNSDRFEENSDVFSILQSYIDDCIGSDVFIFATVNSLFKIPESLYRSGRLNPIKLYEPCFNDKKRIIELNLKKYKMNRDIDIDYIAKLLQDKSCADLEEVINRAGILAGYKGHTEISTIDIVESVLRLNTSIPLDTSSRVTQLLKQVAYHEAGHVLVSECLEPGSVIVSTIDGNGSPSGYTMYFQEDESKKSYKARLIRVLTLLAGKAAEEIVFGLPSTGCFSDLERAGDVISEEVSDLGLFGFMCLDSHNNKSSESSKWVKNLKITTLLEEYYLRVKYMIVSNREFLNQIADALLDKRLLISKDINDIRKKCLIVE